MTAPKDKLPRKKLPKLSPKSSQKLVKQECAQTETNRQKHLSTYSYLLIYGTKNNMVKIQSFESCTNAFKCELFI